MYYFSVPTSLCGDGWGEIYLSFLLFLWIYHWIHWEMHSYCKTNMTMWQNIFNKENKNIIYNQAILNPRLLAAAEFPTSPFHLSTCSHTAIHRMHRQFWDFNSNIALCCNSLDDRPKLSPSSIKLTRYPGLLGRFDQCRRKETSF